MRRSRFVGLALAISASGVVAASGLALAQRSIATDVGTRLPVTSIGTGTCGDLTPSSPPLSIGVTGAVEHVHVQIHRYRYYCNLAPDFGATLDEHTIRVQPTRVATSTTCKCIHSSSIEIDRIPAGHYRVELWSPPNEAHQRAEATAEVDVVARGEH